MFENEIKFISDFALNKVKELGSFITIEKFLSIDIHPSIKKYVEGEIDYLISEDRKKLIENSLFDYSGAEISNYFTLIGNEIKKTKKISFEDIKNIVVQGVSFNANYVVRPKWSLSKLIFGNNKSVTVNELKLMLNYTYYYEYLNNVFLAYLSKKKILNITVTEFELIVNKIDRELFMLHQSKLVDNALYAIADYFSIGGLNKSIVTVESVENFLKEKNLTELLFKLKRAYANSAKKKVDIDEIRKVLYSTLSIDSPFVEDDNPEKVIADEKHFENPLKEDFLTSEPISENVEFPGQENVFDLSAKGESEEFISEEEILENPFTKEVVDEKSLEELKQEEALSEPEKFEIKKDDIINTEIIFEENKELAIREADVTIPVTEIGINISDHISVEESESILKKSIDDEDVLASLTEEIDRDKDDEIVILDEKQQEDLLNFYDNELEISIDDDLPITKTKKVEVDTNIADEINELEFEPELHIDEVLEDEVPIEKIDFEKDLLGTDESKLPENVKEEDAIELPGKGKVEDVFTYLSKKEIDRIIKNLFNSDSEDFANTVEKISDCGTYDEATHILDNVFKYARIKPHSKDAKLLSEVVAKYFNVDL
jgi:hypothetical protein